MARTFAYVKVSIWDDDDWRDLRPPAQHLYFVLLTSPTLSHCGTVDWRPKRIAKLAGGWTVEAVEAAAAELIERLYLVVDEDTEEALIRSFVRHDGLMNQPKMAVAMATAHSTVASKILRGVVVHELRRLREDQPNLKGWGPKALEVLGKGSVDPSTYPLGKGSRKGIGKGTGEGNSEGIGKGSPTPYSLLLTPNSSLPAPHTHPETPLELDVVTTTDGTAPDEGEAVFAAFWDTYPRREGKGAARAAFTKAVAKAGPHRVLAGAARLRDDPNLPTDRTKIPHPATWLNQERWDDDPLPPRQDSRPAAQGPMPLDRAAEVAERGRRLQAQYDAQQTSQEA